jgi:cyclopropane fatty-acyl-phospholipid synthase-like methyltransferase
MCKSLAADELDVAVCLTEGCIADIVKGGDHSILGVFVSSPLTWGVHVHSESSFTDVESLRGKVFGISRPTSGSHLMSFVNAMDNSWDLDRDCKFEIVGNLDGARQALRMRKADAFMWEKFTTKPVVDSGEWRRVGECVTPWPCFVITVRNAFLKENGALVHAMLATVAAAAKDFSADAAAAVEYASRRFSLKAEDVAEWFKSVRWSCEAAIDEATIALVFDYLQRVGVLKAEEVAATSPMKLVSKHTSVKRLPGMMWDWRVKAVRNALREAGKADGPLTVDDLTALGHLDQYHYLGVEACDHVATILGLKSGRHVLDIGSGIGGPARYLAHKTGCTVTGVDAQALLVDASRELTKRAQLDGRVRFVAGDFLATELSEQYDHFISMLVFLHIPVRKPLFDLCFERLKPGGTFVIEDFYEQLPLRPAEVCTLRTVVGATSIVQLSTYKAQLEAAGFVDVECVDLTSLWRQWTKARHEAFVATKERSIAMHGEDHYALRSKFYEAIDGLFEGGRLGGVRITGRRLGELENDLTRGRQSMTTCVFSGSTAKLNETGTTMTDVVRNLKDIPNGWALAHGGLE